MLTKEELAKIKPNSHVELRGSYYFVKKIIPASKTCNCLICGLNGKSLCNSRSAPCIIKDSKGKTIEVLYEKVEPTKDVLNSIKLSELKNPNKSEFKKYRFLLKGKIAGSINASYSIYFYAKKRPKPTKWKEIATFMAVKKNMLRVPEAFKFEYVNCELF